MQSVLHIVDNVEQMLKYIRRLGHSDTMLSYRNRLLLIGGVVTIAVLGTIFLQAPQPTLTVDQLMDERDKHIDNEVAVRGEIRDGSINESTMTFILEGSEYDLIVHYSRHPVIILVHQLLEPLMAPIRRFIPPAGGLDFSLFFVGIFLMVLRMAMIGMGFFVSHIISQH